MFLSPSVLVRRWHLSAPPAAANPRWQRWSPVSSTRRAGSISIGGVNVKDIDKNELMDTVSFVFQNSHLIKGSILDNVRMGKTGRHG